MMVSNRNLLFQGSTFRGYVSFREGINEGFYNSWDYRCNSRMFGTENLISKVPQYSGVTWPSPKGSGGSKAIPCVIHQTAKTHTLKETCCNWWSNAVFVEGFVICFIVFTCRYVIYWYFLGNLLYSYMPNVDMYVACGHVKRYKKRPESRWGVRGQSMWQETL